MNNITDKIEDVQNTPDKRHLDIDKVGIKSIRYVRYNSGPIT